MVGGAEEPGRSKQSTLIQPWGLGTAPSTRRPCRVWLSMCGDIWLLLSPEQARSWQLNGNAIVASKYHHGAVECVLVTPLTAPPPSSRPASAKPGAGAGAGDAGGAGTGGKIWTGSADGTVFCWWVSSKV